MAMMRLFGLFLFVSLITFSTAAALKCIGTPGGCLSTTKACINVFKISDNKTLTDGTGCDASGRCIKTDFPYCSPSSFAGVTDTVCCCNKDDCNVKTFTPLGVEECLEADGITMMTCNRSAELELPMKCYSEFKNEADTTPIEAGCDDGDKKCTNMKDECKKDSNSTHWICCCGKKDCNDKDFIPSKVTTVSPTASVSSTTTTPKTVKQCLDHKGVNDTEDDCKRDARNCYNKFMLNDNKTITESGCDNDNNLCTEEKKENGCFKTSDAWFCCCNDENNCNNKSFTPAHPFPATPTPAPPTPAPTKLPPTPKHSTGPPTTPGKGAADLKMGMMMVMTGLLMHMIK